MSKLSYSDSFIFGNPDNPRLKIDDSLKIGIKDNPKVMITFQIKNDEGIWPRSFEDAFILTNSSLFDLESLSNELIFKTAIKYRDKKLNFAIKYGINDTSKWKTPDYIIEGLKWLSEMGD